MKLGKEPLIWLAVHVILFFVIFFTPNQFACQYCQTVGVLIIIIGAIIWAIAKKEMGRIEIGVSADKFVSKGIYSKLRHPLYLGVKIMYIGFGIFFMSTVGLILTIIVLIPFHMYRRRKEEKELTKRYGKKYLDYMKRTWF
jgi:protein-S-isoprenylcysteine O-methyltransferase Ste14